MPTCAYCSREGDLVMQDAMPPNPREGIEHYWVFRFYLCRYHRAAENRRRRPGTKVHVLEYYDDDAVLCEDMDRGR